MNKIPNRKSKKSISIIITRIIIFLLLSLLALTVIYPLFFTANTSLKTDKDWSTAKYSLSIQPYFGNYVKANTIALIGRTFLNSLIVTTCSVFIVLIICSLAAYAVTKIRFLGRNVLFFIILASMMVPIQTIIYPFFKVMSDFNLINNYLGLILAYVTFGIPLTTYQLAAYFKQIPNDLIDAARIDGASTLKIIFFIIYPISRPVIITVSLINTVWMWNDILMPLIIMQKTKMFTLILSLTKLHAEVWGIAPPLVMAGSVVGILPLLILYFFLQRHILKGMTEGAIKGQ